jgi:hypothetical protein
MKSSQARIGNLWCRLMHTAPMWPSHGQYECRTCGRRKPVCWEGARTGNHRKDQGQQYKNAQGCRAVAHNGAREGIGARTAAARR